MCPQADTRQDTIDSKILSLWVSFICFMYMLCKLHLVSFQYKLHMPLCCCSTYPVNHACAILIPVRDLLVVTWCVIINN